MKVLQVSKFKARCLGLLRAIRDTGEPMAVTLRGETLAVVHPPGPRDPVRRESVAETLDRLEPLLLAEEDEFIAPERVAARPDALAPLPADDPT